MSLAYDTATFDACANFTYPRFSDTLEFEPYYGLTKQAAWSLLEDTFDPLTAFLKEKRLRRSSSINIVSSDRRMQRAFYAAVALCTQLGVDCDSTKLAGAFLTSDSTSCEVPLIFDTGCGHSITPFADDFVSDIEPPPSGVGVTNFENGHTLVEGAGWVEWHVRDAFGRTSIIRTRAYLISSATVRLFSPGQFKDELDARKKSGASVPEGVGNYSSDGEVFSFRDDYGQTLEFALSSQCKLPVMDLVPDDEVNQVGVTDQMLMNLNIVQSNNDARTLFDEANANLTRPQKELKLWHCRLAHCGFPWVQDLMRVQKTEVGSEGEPPLIPTKNTTTSRCDPPKCSACIYAKQHRRTPGTQKIVTKPETEMAIRRDNMKPGECVSGDQYYSATPGRLPHTYGKEKDDVRYTGGTLLVDHYSAYTHVGNQVSLGTGETISVKHDFEYFARLHGVQVKKYRADNHPFDSQEFRDDLALHEQGFELSGVGAHHQNGVVERSVQTISTWARAMMMHQLEHWPEVFDEALWPFAVEHAVYLWNNLPRHRSGLSPLELFTGTKSHAANAIQQARVWGCPAYVLDPTLQNGHKLPKWQKRSRCGVYLGMSPQHATSVGRILNLKTGAISPQYHVVYDELFSTVFGARSDNTFDDTMWSNLIQLGGEDHTLTPSDRLDPETMDVANDLFDEFRSANGEDPSDDPVTYPVVDSVPEGDDLSDCNSETSSTASTQVTENVPYRTRSGRTSKRSKQYQPTHSSAKRYRDDDPVLFAAIGRPKPVHHVRPHAQHERLRYQAGGNPNAKVKQSVLQQQLHQSLNWDPSTFLNEGGTARTRRVLLSLLKSVDAGEWHPSALAAKTYDENNPSYEMAMNGPNAEGYRQACQTEIDTLEKMDVWELVDREPWMNVLPSTWALKAKLFPSGLVRKLKARLCCRGDRQVKNVDYFETYAPVVSWNTVRLLLVLSAELELATRQVDYTAAFVHAPIDRPPNWDTMSPEEQARAGVYVECARGHPHPGKVYKLKKSLYGLRQSPRNFFHHLKTNLEAVGFEQQIEIDPCLFISPKVICLVYVDDTLLYARKKEDIDEILWKLENERHMSLEAEDEVAGFLGVHIKRDTATGEVTLTQQGLTQRIIDALGCNDLPGVDTPAEEVLGKDEDGEPDQCTFNYASVIGMLWYLYGHSRPDLGFAVSQAARFSFAPKRSHELALIRIGQYLKKTKTKGMILKPMTTSSSFKMDAYVDSDFMGLYGKEKRTDPANVKSRIGYVLCINECPIVWSSRLNDAIALSTMMAEYYALSHCMREVLPLRELTKGVARGLGIVDDIVTDFKTTVWEDNNGALSLANLEPGQHTPRSKFYDCKVHWFRSHITREGSPVISKDGMFVRKIDTKAQIADLFTKPLPKDVFERLRKLMMGW